MVFNFHNHFNLLLFFSICFVFHNIYTYASIENITPLSLLVYEYIILILVILFFIN